MLGSKVKVLLTRGAQIFSQTGLHFQGIQLQNAFNMAAVMGSLEDLMTKFGWPLYQIKFNFPSGNQSIFMPGKMWVIGVDVTQETGGIKPAVATISISRDAGHDGSLYHYSFSVTLLPPKRLIIGIHQMDDLIFKALETAMTQLRFQNNQKHDLPKALLFLRKGLSEGDYQSVLTKEVNGIRRALYRMNKNGPGNPQTKKHFSDAKGKFKWMPEFAFATITRNIVEQIAVFNNKTNQISIPESPIIIQKGLTSSNIWDAIGFFNIKDENKSKPTRITVLFDELKLSSNPMITSDFYQYIHGLHYSYGFAIPFIMGCPGYPAPLTYAAHYSQWFSSLILSADKEMRILNVNRSLLNRPHLEYVDVKQSLQHFRETRQQGQQQMESTNISNF